jgi:hypothetical protein
MTLVQQCGLWCAPGQPAELICRPTVQLYLSEAARVLHPGGHLYISWYPSWQSGRGHHIHPDMVLCLLQQFVLHAYVHTVSQQSTRLRCRFPALFSFMQIDSMTKKLNCGLVPYANDGR